MSTEKGTVVYLKDYQAPNYFIDSIDLVFDLHEHHVQVESLLRCRINPDILARGERPPFILWGKKLILKRVELNEVALIASLYQLEAESLTLPKVPDTFTLKIVTEIFPEKNTELSGLYRSNLIYCTQCEAQGFRRITFFPDRPDIMAKFSTTIYADKKQYPVLLSNGNCVSRGIVDAKRHWVKWEDPFLKPCYLFALVAGDLVSLEDYFVTRSGRLVTLKIYVERENQDKCEHAMEALKKSMRWDEETYGREYDLDIYMIVAVNDFNAGAMENKGLNIFNSKYILARPETATDDDYAAIDAVVGHEYFHNWSGNRVTCRDWFQLSLKEGLTVFREHHFSDDISQSPVSLIQHARALRTHQFAEDGGPMAHSVRPESYLEINNFYTMTVYEKGAEVIRMLKTLLGWENFRLGMDLYFEQHDGQAVTIDDFVAAMETVSKIDLKAFRLWYSQAGTPTVFVTHTAYYPETKTYEITLKQSCPATPGQPHKEPFVIPILIGLLDESGKDILSGNQVLMLEKETQTFSLPNITNIEKKPILSFLRDFSAPVKVEMGLQRLDDELLFLMSYDSNDFCRWDASQQLTEKQIWSLVGTESKQWSVSKPWLEAYRTVLEDVAINPALKAEILSLPSLNALVETRSSVDIEKLYEARLYLKRALANGLKESFFKIYALALTPGPYAYTPEAVSNRRLKNLCLGYLCESDHEKAIEICLNQWKGANNMTDSLGVLGALMNWKGVERTQVLAEFYDKWKQNPLVLDKWFRMQALSELPDTLVRIKELTLDPAFDLKNPNKVYALIGAFSNSNLPCFHAADGSGYAFLSEIILKLNDFNPQVAARMAGGFSSWKKFDKTRQEKIQKELTRLLAEKTLSKNVFEVVSKCLAIT